MTTFISWAGGFERNVTIDAAQLVYPEAKVAIMSFNRTVADMSELMEKRSQLNKIELEARKIKDSVWLINTRRDIALMEHEINVLQAEANRYRKRIRAFRMEGVNQLDTVIALCRAMGGGWHEQTVGFRDRP